MKGNITRRGKSSWRIKYEAGRDPESGVRDTRYLTFRGTKKEAETELVRLLGALEKGLDVRPDKMTVGEFLDRWERDFAATNVSPKTRERYVELLRMHVRPYLGARPVQKLRPTQLSELYARLVGTAEDPRLSARTVGHVHRVLHRALGHAVTWQVIAVNPADHVSPPKVEATEIAILSSADATKVLTSLKGRVIAPIVSLALATGMRRGELLALRWKDADLTGNVGGKVRVEQAIEQTKQGLRFKSPKTKHGRRTIAIPAATAADLRALKIEQQKVRLALGAGRLPDEALIFPNFDGSPRNPNVLSTEFVRALKSLGLPKVTFHALRHTHASALIAAGLDVLTISRRLGHANPTITLGVYGHLFSNTDDRAAQAIEAAFGIGTE